MVTKKTINSLLIIQLSRQELSWLGPEDIANIVVGAELKVGMGGGAASFVDVEASRHFYNG